MAKFVALVIIAVVADDVLWLGRQLVDEIQQLTAVRMARESVNSHHFATDLDNLCLSVNDHWNFSESFLKTASKGPFGLVAYETQGIAIFMRPVSEVLHDWSTVEHTGGC